MVQRDRCSDSPRLRGNNPIHLVTGDMEDAAFLRSRHVWSAARTMQVVCSVRSSIRRTKVSVGAKGTPGTTCPNSVTSEGPDCTFYSVYHPPASPSSPSTFTSPPHPQKRTECKPVGQCSGILRDDKMQLDFVDINGARLAYRLCGPREAPLIITLHGGRGMGEGTRHLTRIYWRLMPACRRSQIGFQGIWAAW
jgi:hypothetical protein